MKQKSSEISIKAPEWSRPLLYIGLALAITNLIGWSSVPMWVILLFWLPYGFPLIIFALMLMVDFWPVTLVYAIIVSVYLLW